MDFYINPWAAALSPGNGHLGGGLPRKRPPRPLDCDKVAHTDAILVTVGLLTVTVAVGHALHFRDTVNIHVLELSRIVGVREILHCDDRTALKTAVFVLALDHADLAHAAALVAGANLRGVTQAHDLAGLHLVVFLGLMVGCSRGDVAHVRR